MASFNVSVKNKEDKYQHFEVPEEVFTYITQLEAAIKFPDESKIKEFYKERFSDRLSTNDDLDNFIKEAEKNLKHQIELRLTQLPKTERFILAINVLDWLLKKSLRIFLDD